MMKRFFIYFLIWIVSNGFQLAFGQEKNRKPIIVIDPGHGGKDYGAIGANDLMEKDVVLGVAKEIIRLNKDVYGNALNIYLTRYSDTLISLNHRARLARTIDADMFISIHCNQSVQRTARGIETYVADSDGEFMRPSIWLANSIHSKMIKELGLKGRGVKFANFQVLKETGHCPSLLLEFGFLSNSTEEEYFSKQGSLIACAFAILETLLKY